MVRFLAGVASALLLVMAGFFLMRAQADRRGTALPPPPVDEASAAPMALSDFAGPPAASERTREQKRFARYDKDKNGIVAREEYMLSRRKAFAKLDTNGDGRLSFDEYSVKTTAKFVAADKDRNGGLSATEFASTRVVRKAKPRPKCAPGMQAPRQSDDASEDT